MEHTPTYYLQGEIVIIDYNSVIIITIVGIIILGILLLLFCYGIMALLLIYTPTTSIVGLLTPE
jgi:hypothetical protein